MKKSCRLLVSALAVLMVFTMAACDDGIGDGSGYESEVLGLVGIWLDAPVGGSTAFTITATQIGTLPYTATGSTFTVDRGTGQNPRFQTVTYRVDGDVLNILATGGYATVSVRPYYRQNPPINNPTDLGTVYSLPDNTSWVDPASDPRGTPRTGSLSAITNNNELWYTITISKRHQNNTGVEAPEFRTFYLWWADQNNGFIRPASVAVNVDIYQPDGTLIHGSQRNGWSSPRAITPDQEGRIRIRVTPQSSGSRGNFHIYFTYENKNPYLGAASDIEGWWYSGTTPAAGAKPALGFRSGALLPGGVNAGYTYAARTGAPYSTIEASNNGYNGTVEYSLSSNGRTLTLYNTLGNTHNGTTVPLGVFSPFIGNLSSALKPPSPGPLPPALTLTEREWGEGTIDEAHGFGWHSFPVTAGVSHTIRINQGSGNITSIVARAFFEDGEVLQWTTGTTSFTPAKSGMGRLFVFTEAGTPAGTATGTYRIGYTTGTNTML